MDPSLAKAPLDHNPSEIKTLVTRTGPDCPRENGGEREDRGHGSAQVFSPWCQSTHLSSFVLGHSSTQTSEDYFLYEVCRLVAKATPVHPLFCYGKHSRKSMYEICIEITHPVAWNAV